MFKKIMCVMLALFGMQAGVSACRQQRQSTQRKCNVLTQTKNGMRKQIQHKNRKQKRNRMRKRMRMMNLHKSK